MSGQGEGRGHLVTQVCLNNNHDPAWLHPIHTSPSATTKNNTERERERTEEKHPSPSINKILNIRYSATSQTIITQPITNHKTSHLICSSRWRALLVIRGSKLRPAKEQDKSKRQRQAKNNEQSGALGANALSEPFKCLIYTDSEVVFVHIYFERNPL